MLQRPFYMYCTDLLRVCVYVPYVCIIVHTYLHTYVCTSTKLLIFISISFLLMHICNLLVYVRMYVHVLYIHVCMYVQYIHL